MQNLVIVESFIPWYAYNEIEYTVMRRLKRWSNEELDLLNSLYTQTRVKYLATKFPYRTKATIVAKALNLGLPSAKLWQPEENTILKNLFSTTSKEELLKLLPKRSWLAIMAHGERLGLKRYVNKPKLRVNENYFKEWTVNMAYILGFILADGCIIKGTYKGYSDSLKLGVQLCDIDILEKIKKELNSGHKITITKNAAHFCISSQKIVNDLKRIGISYRKSLKEKTIKVPDKYIKDFVRGIIDGDGGISIDRNKYPTLRLCGGRDTVTFVRDYFLAKYNIYLKLSERRYSLGVLYDIKYRGRSAVKLIDFLYRDAKLYLNRKYQLAVNYFGE